MTGERTQDIEVWKQVFQELMQEVKTGHQWTLESDKDIRPDALEPGWTQYQQKAFARFQCSSCSRRWASAHIPVLFQMRWDKKQRRGQVKMRVFTQRCQKCPSAPFEVPEFTLENISRILNNLVLRILKKCYREGFRAVEEVAVIMDAGLEGPHDASNCEACMQGFCAQSSGGSGLETGPPRGTHLPPSQPPLPRGGKSLPPPVNPGAASHPKNDPKVRQTSPARHAPSTLTVNPKSNPPKTEPQVSHAPKPPTALTSPARQVPSTLTVIPKSNPSRMDPKVSHAPKPSTALTSVANPNIPILPKADLKPQRTSKSSTSPTRPTQQATCISAVNPHTFNPYKGDPASATQMAPPKPIRAGGAGWRSSPGHEGWRSSPGHEGWRLSPGHEGWRSSPGLAQGSPAPTCCPEDTCIDMCGGCAQCLCRSGAWLCETLLSRCGLGLVALVIVLVVLNQMGII